MKQQEAGAARLYLLTGSVKVARNHTAFRRAGRDSSFPNYFTQHSFYQILRVRKLPVVEVHVPLGGRDVGVPQQATGRKVERQSGQFI